MNPTESDSQGAHGTHPQGTALALARVFPGGGDSPQSGAPLGLVGATAQAFEPVGIFHVKFCSRKNVVPPPPFPRAMVCFFGNVPFHFSADTLKKRLFFFFFYFFIPKQAKKSFTKVCFMATPSHFAPSSPPPSSALTGLQRCGRTRRRGCSQEAGRGGSQSSALAQKPCFERRVAVCIREHPLRGTRLWSLAKVPRTLSASSSLWGWVSPWDQHEELFASRSLL